MARNPHASYEASDHQRMPILPIVNNLITTDPGYALDARQGKVLYDKINQVGGALYQYYTSGTTLNTPEQVIIESAILEPGVYLASSGLMASYPIDDIKLLSTGLRVYRESENYQTPIDIGVDACCSKSSHLTIAFYSLTRFKIQLVATALDQKIAAIVGDGRFNYLHVTMLRLF